MKTAKWGRLTFWVGLVLLATSPMLFPVVTIRFGPHAIQIIDDSKQEAFEVLCQGCHARNPQLKAALAKPYDSQSKSNHRQKYFREKALVIEGQSKYLLEKDIYLAFEGGRLVLVNGREAYKWTFAEDAVILADDQGRPAFIYTLNPILKAKLPATAVPIRK